MIGVLLAAAVAGHQPLAHVPASGTLTEVDLLAIADIARAKGSSRDQFTPDPASQFIGRRFVLKFPVEATYDLPGHKLRLTYDQQDDITLRRRKLGRSTRKLMTNGFGVSRMVTSDWVILTGVKVVHWYAEGEKEERFVMLREYPVILDRDPDEARALSKAAMAVISGTVTQVDGDTVSCGFGIANATLDDPHSLGGTVCGVKVDVEEVAIIDSRSGAALKTWTR